MSTANPAPAPAFPIRYADTMTGRAVSWYEKFIPGLKKAQDFPGAIESLGIKKAARMMREEADNV